MISSRKKAIIFSTIHFFIILQLITTSSSSKDACRSFLCGSLQIRFPFYLKGIQPSHCGYHGFELFCTSNNETVIELPLLGKPLVKEIDYKSQSLDIHDQNGCFPQRFIAGSNLSDTPFKTETYENYTIFNCSRDVDDKYEYDLYGLSIDCSSCPGWTYKLFALGPSYYIAESLPSHCEVFASSISWPSSFSNNDLDLSSLTMNWDEPNCSTCETGGQICGYENQTSSHAIGCSDKPKEKKMARKNIAGRQIAISVSLGLFVFLLFVLIMFIKRRNKANKEERGNQLRIEKFLEKNALKPTRYSHAEIKKITNKFVTKLGQGGYGSVFEGKLTNGIQVAVKVLDNSKGSNNGEEFVNEVGTIGRIHHLNVVRLLGFCVEGSTKALIYEFMSNGSLDKFIFSNGKDKTLINLGWKKLQEIAIGIARGMEYLHQGCDQRILHFDIKPQNILLDHNFTPKISDFGLAKLCTKDTFVTVSMAAARGTMGYIAPEVFSRNFGAVSYKSDVYSFGMLLLEMVGGKKNTEIKMETRSDEEYFPEWVYNRLNHGEDLGILAEAEGLGIVKKLTMVSLWCIQWNPVDRPSMNGVLHMLEGNTENLLMAPNPFASATSVSSTSRVNHTNETELTPILEDY
ncbi:hypothetical protein MKW98_017190 [Papaver atlanticum]|uniref:Protein kinase domain-containing protein n=1 Tax=Papaver atlanticum TaxID=357466 RepID=A0AAD4XBF3_9MAGN|nr:hypothetical protein MKW98_017190 [Papaver atlanticum]